MLFWVSRPASRAWNPGLEVFSFRTTRIEVHRLLQLLERHIPLVSFDACEDPAEQTPEPQHMVEAHVDQLEEVSFRYAVRAHERDRVPHELFIAHGGPAPVRLLETDLFAKASPSQGVIKGGVF